MLLGGEWEANGACSFERAEAESIQARKHTQRSGLHLRVCVFVQSGIVGVKESEKWMKKGGVGVWRVQWVIAAGER